jgi:hypothetical protein
MNPNILFTAAAKGCSGKSNMVPFLALRAYRSDPTGTRGRIMTQASDSRFIQGGSIA